VSVPATVSTSFTLPALQAWGERFGANFVFNDPEEGPGQVVVLLSGELGAGKTTLAQSICRGFGVTEEVTSPTFALVHRYQGKAPVFHVDLHLAHDPEHPDSRILTVGSA
jgi:tRNA threonylcarbamoyladenosine biosynthesis protein TsaE